MHGQLKLLLSPDSHRTQVKLQFHPHSHEAQIGSPASAESSPPIISRIKPKSQVPSPSSVSFSMHRIALALAASASAKHYIKRSKRCCFDRLIVNSIFKSKAFSTQTSGFSLMSSKYRKALETDSQLQRRLLNDLEMFSIRVSIIVCSCTKKMIFCKWRRYALFRSSIYSLQHLIFASFQQWSKVIHAKMAAEYVAAQNRLASNIRVEDQSVAPLFQLNGSVEFHQSSYDSKYMILLTQSLNGCLHKWKVYTRNQFSRRNKLIGMTSCMGELARIFAYRGCQRKGLRSPPAVPAFLEAGACIDYQKLRDASAHYTLSACFIMWAELSPVIEASRLMLQRRPIPPSKISIGNLNLKHTNEHASPITMTRSLSPFEQNSGQSPDGPTSPIKIQIEGESSIDSDSYAAAVLMDHHQSLCNQSVPYQARNFRRQVIQLPEVQGTADTSLVSICEVSGDSDDASDSSNNPHFSQVLTSTLRPLSPLTQAHIRANIICPPKDKGKVFGLPSGKQASHSVPPKMQAFKMIKSPPIKRVVPAAISSIKTQVPRASISSDFPTAGSRAHSSFLSSAVALRIKMSQELQTKESTLQKSTPGHLHHSGLFDAARQPWVRQ